LDVPFGTPSVYTPELAEEICARLSTGESLKSICRDPGMPPFATVQGWARTNHCGFTALYNCARELQAQTFADELIDIADDGTNDWVRRENQRGGVSYVVDKEHIARSRLRFEARQWVISKILPSRLHEALRPRQAGLCSLDQQVALELGECVQHPHDHLARSRRQISAAQLKAMNTDVHAGEPVHGSPYVDSVAA
jgi:hypothetical protein